ncbi:hypothetical protein E6O75_ATG00842 [Venturia nashicola]|uniref:Uncharacterized protein n=1 Tax=Venturia nashicola TaxID=86259 RepID=A0A4Z1PTM1_9PEZI|nr:hypothetical protein E6O75_ATG00842 [Venturia nashicola]
MILKPTLRFVYLHIGPILIFFGLYILFLAKFQTTSIVVHIFVHCVPRVPHLTGCGFGPETAGVGTQEELLYAFEEL